MNANGRANPVLGIRLAPSPKAERCVQIWLALLIDAIPRTLEAICFGPALPRILLAFGSGPAMSNEHHAGACSAASAATRPERLNLSCALGVPIADSCGGCERPSSRWFRRTVGMTCSRAPTSWHVGTSERFTIRGSWIQSVTRTNQRRHR